MIHTSFLVIHFPGLPVGNLNRNIDYGISVAETTVFQGRRWNPVQGYLREAMGRDNLHIMTETVVKKVGK